MKGLLAILIILGSYGCKTENTCLEYASLEWCVEASAQIYEADGILQIEDRKDGLFFAADVIYEKLDRQGINMKQTEIESNIERYTWQEFRKGNIAFYDFSETQAPMSDLSSSEIVSGDIIGLTKEGAFTIQYRGVNKNKVNRYIELLLQ